jgi:type 1 glutamine amidotransferase
MRINTRAGQDLGQATMRLRKCLGLAVLASWVPLMASDYLTEGNDPGRTGWMKDEKVFTLANVKDLKLLWKVELESQPREMHNLFSPLIAGRVMTARGPREIAIVAGISDDLFGIDVASGELTIRVFLVVALCCASFQGQEIQPDQKERVDAAVPRRAQAKPKQPRRMLVTNLSMRDGKPVRGSSAGTIPVGNYAIQQIGKVTGAYEAVFNDDIEMFRPANIKQFDAICFNNTLGVLFDDPELRASLLGFVESGKGFVGIHDAIATFVQYPKYDQWPEFGRMIGGTENGGHPWNGEVMTMKVEDPGNPINAAFGGQDFQIADQAFQLQEPVLRDRMHVLLRIDAEKTGPARRILPVRKQDMDFPMSWIRRQGKGRVFYTGLGHGPDVFSNPRMLEHLLAGIQYALGDLAADDAPGSSRGR